MKKIIFLKGLPGSGKSTWAKEFCAKWPEFKRVNKDDLRAMLDNGKYTKANEQFVLKIRESLILEAVLSGFNVIVDDTNLDPKHLARIKDIAAELTKYCHPTKVEVKFFDTPLEECIARDQRRANPVGRKVIEDMYERYLKPAPPVPTYDQNLSWCVIFDLDGTLAKMKDRGPFDWKKVGQDELNLPVWTVMNGLPANVKIVIMSGRDSVCRPETEEWLKRSIGNIHSELHMRPEGDTRKDSIVKRELYDKYILGKYNVLFVLDDRDQVVKMWREELGLTCFQVAPGAF